VKLRRIALEHVGIFNSLDVALPTFTRDDRADVVLITGPNGSGKTTLLRAIGTVLGSTNSLGQRVRDESIITAEVSIDGESSFLQAGRPLAGFVGRQDELHIDGWPSVIWSGSYNGTSTGGLSIRTSGTKAGQVAQNESRFGELASMAGPVFAYDAYRTVEEVSGLSIGLGEPNALFEASTFGKTMQVGTFDNWVANLKTKLALARDEGDRVSAARYQTHLSAIEGAIGELLGEPFEFKLLREPRLQVLGLVNGVSVPLALLPDGLRSTVAWLGDVLRRLDTLELPPGTDSLLLPIVVLLDEVDAHLHPAWQRSILHIAERLLPNAQIIASTHSPFVVQSAVDACVVRLGDRGILLEVLGSQYAESSDAVLADVLGLEGAEFGIEITTDIEALRGLRNRVLRREATFEEFHHKATELAGKSHSLDRRLGPHVEEVRRRLAEL
jgi:predicted ATPase